MNDQRVKLLYVNMSIDPVGGGGTAERTVQIAKAVAGMNCECSLMALNIGITDELRDNLNNISLILLKCINKRFYIPEFDFSVVDDAVKDSDMVHLMGHWTLINAIAYYYIRKYDKPYTICPAGALPVFGRSKLLKILYNTFIGKKILGNADLCVAITEKERSDFYSCQVSDEKIVLISNGINFEDYKYKDPRFFIKKFNTQKKIILFVGRLNYIKGPDILVNAFIEFTKINRDYQLVMIGPDEGMQVVMENIIQHSAIDTDTIDDIIFAGYIGGKEKSMAYHAADLVVIPSRQEAMSIVVLEAGISGTPVIITDQCGFDQVEDIDGGLVVPATIEGIRSGMEQLLMDPDLLSRKGDNLKRFCRSHYTWTVAAEKYLMLYR